MILNGNTITIRGTSMQLMQREKNNLMRSTFTDLGVWFHDNLMEKRFTPEGARELQYAARSPSYQRRKKRQFGHNDPLVWSGRSKRSTLQIQDVRTTATRNKVEARVVIHAPALNFKNPRSRVHPRKEVVRISTRESVTLTGKTEEFFTARANALSETRTIEASL